MIAKALTNQRNTEYVATQKSLEKEIAERKRRAYLDPEKAAEHKNKGNELFKAGSVLICWLSTSTPSIYLFLSYSFTHGKATFLVLSASTLSPSVATQMTAKSTATVQPATSSLQRSLLPSRHVTCVWWLMFPGLRFRFEARAWVH